MQAPKRYHQSRLKTPQMFFKGRISAVEGHIPLLFH